MNPTNQPRLHWCAPPWEWYFSPFRPSHAPSHTPQNTPSRHPKHQPNLESLQISQTTLPKWQPNPIKPHCSLSSLRIELHPHEPSRTSPPLRLHHELHRAPCAWRPTSAPATRAPGPTPCRSPTAARCSSARGGWGRESGGSQRGGAARRTGVGPTFFKSLGF